MGSSAYASSPTNSSHSLSRLLGLSRALGLGPEHQRTDTLNAVIVENGRGI